MQRTAHLPLEYRAATGLPWACCGALSLSHDDGRAAGQGAHVEVVATERAGVSGAAVLDRLRRVAGHDDIDYCTVRGLGS